MNIFTKSLLYFGCTIILGNIFLILNEYIRNPDESLVVMIDGLKSTIRFIMLSSLFCLPLLIPILIFFTLIKTYRPYFPLNIILGGTFGLVVSVAWMLILNFLTNWLEQYYYWLPFVVAATISAILVELLSTPFPRKLSINSTNLN